MRLGLATMFRSWEDELALAKKHDVKGLRISARRIYAAGMDLVSELTESGLVVAEVSFHEYNPLTTDRDKLSEQKLFAGQFIPMMSDIKCSHFLINGGNYHPSGFQNGDQRNFTDDALDKSVEQILPLMETAEKHEINIAIEPKFWTVVNTPERFLQLKDRIGSDRLTIVLDVCNFIAFREYWRQRETIDHLLDKLAGHFSIVHAKDIHMETGRHILMHEVQMGAGEIDWVYVMWRLKEYSPDCWLILEHCREVEETDRGLVWLKAAISRESIELR